LSSSTPSLDQGSEGVNGGMMECVECGVMRK